jgi:hypothetical protein
MARDLLTKNTFVPNASLADPVANTVTQANGSYIAGGSASEQIVIRVTQTAASAKAVTVRAGVHPPAISAGQGDYVSAQIAQNAVLWLGPFTSGRFLQADGKINIDYEAGFTGSATCFVLPRTA